MKSGFYFSEKLNQKVYTWTMKRDAKNPYSNCECCGKPLRSTIYSVTDEEGLESLYGSECIKTLNLSRVKE